MATEFVAPNKGCSTDGPETAQVTWFRRQHPNFFTSAVIANRKGVRSSGDDLKHPVLWRYVTRRIGIKKLVPIFLHISTNLQTFTFKDGVLEWGVEEQQIIDALRAKGEYVGLVLGTDILRINRLQLLVAFNDLRAMRESAGKTR